MSVRHFLENHWPSITIAVTATAIACAFLVMLRSMPPHLIVMATGREGDAYYEIGERYRAALSYENVQVQLVPTAGSVENLAMLRDPHAGASVALIEGGILSAAETSGVESLGTVFYEPLWWFHKREILGEAADRLRGQRVSIGPEGSGTRALTLQLLKRTGMEAQVGDLLALEPREAGEKLLSGQIDMAFMMTSWDSPVVAALSLKETEVAARQLGIELKSIEVRNPNDFDSAFTSAMNFHANAIVILSAPVMTIYAGRLAELARKNGLPAISNVSDFPKAGGLMSYGPDLTDLYKRAAVYVDKILKGVKPADLPVEQPTKFELVINLTTAKALGIAIPQALLATADEVIE